MASSFGVDVEWFGRVRVLGPALAMEWEREDGGREV